MTPLLLLKVSFQEEEPRRRGCFTALTPSPQPLPVWVYFRASFLKVGPVEPAPSASPGRPSAPARTQESQSARQQEGGWSLCTARSRKHYSWDSSRATDRSLAGSTPSNPVMTHAGAQFGPAQGAQSKGLALCSIISHPW